MRGHLHARKTLKGLVADLRFKKESHYSLLQHHIYTNYLQGIF